MAIDAMLATSREPFAEEFAIHDFEGFGLLQLDENESLARVSWVARGIRQRGLAFAAWAAICDNDQLNHFDDAYRGDYSTVEAYAEELLDDLGLQAVLDQQVPESFRPYVTIDVAGLARDLELSGVITAVDHTGGVWIFEGTTW